MGIRTSFNHRVIDIYVTKLQSINIIYRGVLSNPKCLGYRVIFNYEKARSRLDTIIINGSLNLGLANSTTEDQFVIYGQLIGRFPAEHLFEIQEYVG